MYQILIMLLQNVSLGFILFCSPQYKFRFPKNYVCLNFKAYDFVFVIDWISTVAHFILCSKMA